MGYSGTGTMAADCFRLVGTMTLAKKGQKKKKQKVCREHVRMFTLFPNFVSVLNNFTLLVDKYLP